MQRIFETVQLVVKNNINRIRGSLFKCYLAAACMALMGMASSHVHAQELHRLQLPEQGAVVSLNSLADLYEHSILYSSQDLEGIVLKPLNGYYTLPDALDILLGNTPLNAVVTDKRVIVISVAQQDQPQQSNNGEGSMNKRNKLAAGILAVLSTFFGADVARAQQENSAAVQLEEITVTGIRASIISSIGQKRDASGFVDAVSAEDMGKFPDLNLSESLQRIPGLTLARNDFGEGSSVNLRGLGPAFSRVEINGITGPVNDARGGGFNFEILASELFSNAAVKKSFNARDVEGGLAGLIQLQTPRPFDRDGLSVAASIQAQRAENAGDTGPRASVLVSQNWHNRLGVTASLAYSDTSYLTSSNGGISARPLSAAATDELRAGATQQQLDAVIPSTLNYEINSDQRKTLGATLGLQFRASEQVELSFDSIFADIDGDRRFTRADAPPESQITMIANETIENGVIRSATLTDVQNRIATNDNDTQEDFTQLSAQVKFTPDDRWTITPFVGYSERELTSDASLLSFARGNPDTGLLQRYPVTYNLNGQFIEFSSPGLNLDQGVLAEEYFLNVFLIRPTGDRDEEFSTKLDFQLDFDDSPLTQVNFGARFSSRETAREFIEVRIDNEAADTDLRTLPTLADALLFEDYSINGAPASLPSRIISADPDAILDRYFLNGFDIDAYRSPVTGQLENQRIPGLTLPGSVLINRQPRAAQNSFAGEEETWALYGEMTFEFDNLLFNAGVRYIDTDQTSSGFQVANSLSTAISTENSYSELLPSMSLRYAARDDLQFRAAYSKSLTRPTLNDLRIAESFGGIDESGGSGGRGNPELNPFTSDNIDVGFEWYFAEEGLLALTAFYKDIDGLIVSSSVTEDRQFLSQVSGQLVTGPIVFSLPANGEPAEVKGLEFIVQSRFDFLPGTWSNFGAIFNYTFADSDAAFEEGDVSSEVASIPGLSKNSYNAILYYDDGRLDARLAYAFRERFVESTAASFGVPEFVNDRSQLDLSMNYSVTEHLTLQFQALNLTEERLDTESVLNVPNDTGQLDRRFFLGVRYNF